MEWAEIKRRLVKEGTSVQVLADLEAVPYKTMYNRIMAHQVKDGVTYLTPENTKGMKKAKAISDTKQKQAKEKEKAAGLPEDAAPAKMGIVDITKYNCATCANVIGRPESYSSADGHIEIEKYCTKGHDYGGNHKCCSEYVTAALEPFIKAPEESPNLPEKVPKLTEVPEDKPLIIPFPDPEKAGLCPEVMEMLRENCEACRKLAESYARQASEYAHLLKRYGVDIPAAQKKKSEDLRRYFPEVQ